VHWQSLDFAWILIPCDAQFAMTLVCEKRKKQAIDQWMPYCLGQTAIVSGKKCVVHVNIGQYETPSHACKPATWSDAAMTEVAYREGLCTVFPELCNASSLVISIQNVSAASHACLVELPRGECPEGMFACRDGSCVSVHKRCNNIPDCLFGEDERECDDVGCESPGLHCPTECQWPSCRCRAEFFQCVSGGCVPADVVCDDEENCADGSDEQHCWTLMCSQPQWMCADGRLCISHHQRFDGVEDCPDASDERVSPGVPCPGFQCSDGTCIQNIRLDDGVADCRDAEDEQEFIFHRAKKQHSIARLCQDGSDTLPCGGSVGKCYPRPLRCLYGADSSGNLYTCRNAGHLTDCASVQCPAMYKCPLSYCLPLARVCDGAVDCQDGSDEHHCPMLSCPGMYRCHLDKLCVHPNDVCDGKVDCKLSMDDEKYCVPKLVTSSPKNTNHSLSLPEVITPNHTHLLSMRYQYISWIEPHHMDLESVLLVVDLSHNAITEIPPLWFIGCLNLQFIFLGHNAISRIAMMAFAGVGDLQILDLAGNRLTNLMNQDFEGLATIRHLDLSGNSLFTVEETFFVEHQPLGSVYHTDSVICCMIPPQVACEVSASAGEQSCGDLLIHGAFTYTAMVVGALQLLSSLAPIVLHFVEHKGILHINLALSDALFGCYLIILTFSDLYYRNRFYFYANSWPVSPPCYTAMLAFFLSFQQALFTLLLRSTHTSLLVAFPFKKQLHQRVMNFGGVIWFIAALQVAVVFLLVSFLGLRASAHNPLCQLPRTPPSASYPLLVAFLLFYGACLVTLAGLTGVVVVLIKRSLQMKAAVKTRSDVKRRVMIKSLEVAVINMLSLGTVLITEGLLKAGFELDHKVHLTLTVTLMSISKLCNPWLNSLRMLLDLGAGRGRMQSVRGSAAGAMGTKGKKQTTLSSKK
jgi:hypothetical protein